MHWSYELAEEILKKYPNQEEYVVASGISPSGSVHIGNYREFVTQYYVAKALQSKGKKVREIFSWDEFDRFRKVPKNFPADYAVYVGKPYVEIPSPYSEGESSAKYFEREFESALQKLGMNEIPVQMIYQADEYRSGRYGKAIAHAIKKRKQIYDIIMSFKTQDGDEGERENYYPVAVYCHACGKDDTTVLGFDEKTDVLSYQCKCGHKHSVDVKTADNIKLVWKVDWPMRWKAENICFEAAGIDHHSEGGSYDVGSKIAREIWGIEPPVSTCFAWVGIRGLGNMHSSSGINITPDQLLKVYEPEILRYLYAKYPVGDAFDFGFDDTIIRHYMEFDRNLEKYLTDPNSMPEYDRSVFDLCLMPNSKGNRVNFSTLATVAPLTGFNQALTLKMLQQAGITALGNFEERFAKVKFWLENYQPDRIYKLLSSFNQDYYATLDDEQKGVLAKLAEFLKTTHSESEIQNFLYEIINKPELTKKENQQRQQTYFKIFYNMLFGRDAGPRLYLYLAVANPEDYLKLLQKK